MTNYIIQDWAGNTLQYTGKFNFGSYGTNLGVPLTFNTFDDAWEWLYIKFPIEETFDDYYVLENK